MADPIRTIAELACCTVEEATLEYTKTNDIFDAVENLLKIPESKANKYLYKRVKPDLTEDERESIRIREIMEKFDREQEKRFISSSQLEPLVSTETTSLPSEKVLRNNDFQQCQLPSLQSTVEIQETVYQ